MDRYEFNLKSQQMRKLAADGRYDEAALIADEIDWNRVKNTRLLMLTADIYEATKQPEKEFDILDIAYERSPMGKQLAYRLALLASELKDYEEAENYYKDYVDMAPKDSRRYLLRYRLSKARGEDLDMLIGFLERYLDGDIDERWSYELCELYAKAGYQDKCISLCDELITWFGEGKYVLAALKLKKKYAPLSVSQQKKYDTLRREERESQSDEEEVGAEIARTRNEVLRNRTLPEKMQAVAEKRIQEDAVPVDKNEQSAKNAAEEKQGSRKEKQTSGKIRFGVRTKEEKAGAGTGTSENLTETAETPVNDMETELPAKNREMEAPVKKAEADTPVKNMGSEAVNREHGKNPEVSERVRNSYGEPASPSDGMNAAGETVSGIIGGETRRYDGRAVRRAEARMQKVRENDDVFELKDEEELPETDRRGNTGKEGREALPDRKSGKEVPGTVSGKKTRQEMSEGIPEKKAGENVPGNVQKKDGEDIPGAVSGRKIREDEPDEEMEEVTPDFDIDEIHIKTYSDRAYDTMNIQAELAKSMEAILRTDEARGSQKAAKRPGSRNSGPAVRTYIPPATEAAEEDPFGYEQERREPEKQITGQMSIEEILKDLQTRGILKEDTVESALRVTGQLPLWKVQEGAENTAGQTPEETVSAEGQSVGNANAPQENEAAGVTEERVVKEMEEISLRDFTTGEIDLEIVQNEVDERQKEIDSQSEISLDFGLENLQRSEKTAAGEAADEVADAAAAEVTGAGEAATAEPEIGEMEAGKTTEDEISVEKIVFDEAAAEKTESPEAANVEGKIAADETVQPQETAAEKAAQPVETEAEEMAQPVEGTEQPEESGADETAQLQEAAANEMIQSEENGESELLDEEAGETSETYEEETGEDESVIRRHDPEEDEIDSEEDEFDSEEDEIDSEEDEIDSEEDEIESEEDEIESEEDEIDSEKDEIESEEDEIESEEDEIESEEDEIESEEDEIESEEDEIESEEDEIESEEDEIESEEDEFDSEEDEFESDEDENRRFDTENFLSGLELDLSRLGQEENPYRQMRDEDVKRETEKMDDVFAVIREMETDLNEEDRIYNAYTEEEPKEKLYLDEADRKEFEQYLKITGMESQIAKAINDYVTAYSNDGTSRNPNVLITGGAKTGKSQLAVSLIRAINRHLGRSGRKTARISGFNLNRKTLSASMPKLVGNDLLIEHAGEINRKIVAELMDILPKYTGGMIVVMEDEKARLDHLFEDYPLLADYFPNHLDIKEYDINEWAAVAKSYARSQGYTIDELGTLALYAEIDALYGMLQGLEVDDIKDIVDDAIEHSERKMGSALSRIFGKKKETARQVLHETDFDA